MDKTLKSTIRATDKEAQYDEKAKKLLAQKPILACILVKIVDEFKGMEPKDVIQYIEGEPIIGVVPLEGGLTNVSVESNGQQIVGLNTENSELNEGIIRFDVIFYVRLKDGISQIIINAEIQKDEPYQYDILNRATFYASRLISSQKEREFENMCYNDLKKVYSIWVCMNMKDNALTHIHMTKEDIVGVNEWKGNLDLMNIVMIGISKELPEYNDKNWLHRLIAAIFSKELEVKEKLEILEKEYDIQLEDDVREEVNVMCNLGEGIREEAYEEGKIEGKIEGLKEGKIEGIKEGKIEGIKEANIINILKMYKNDLSIERISQILEINENEVKDIIEKNI